jgi:hypothetical protein
MAGAFPVREAKEGMHDVFCLTLLDSVLQRKCNCSTSPSLSSPRRVLVDLRGMRSAGASVRSSGLRQRVLPREPCSGRHLVPRCPPPCAACTAPPPIGFAPTLCRCAARVRLLRPPDRVSSGGSRQPEKMKVHVQANTLALGSHHQEQVAAANTVGLHGWICCRGCTWHQLNFKVRLKLMHA